MAGDWRAKLLVASVVGFIGLGTYLVIVPPLQIAYGGAARPERDPGLAPGFTKKGMWGAIAASKQAGTESSSGSGSGSSQNGQPGAAR